MTPALLLIDLQDDYLAAPRLQPAAGAVIHRASTLLERCRRQGIPVMHIWTTVHRDPDDRMPHWKSAGKWICVQGTPGHKPPPPLAPQPGEAVLSKRFFSAFENPDLEPALRSAGCDTLILAGVHLHACIRATALDGYERGFEVRIAADAVSSDDPLHAAITRRYLQQRGMRIDTIDRILAQPPANVADVGPVVLAAGAALPAWRQTAIHDRAAMLLRLAQKIENSAQEIARGIVQEVGKPITMAIAEIHRSAALCRATAALADAPLEHQSSPSARYRYEPLGVVAIVTPWNNPLAIPIGKIAPALLFGNTVVWKPSPWAIGTTQRTMALVRQIFPAGTVEPCPGDADCAHALAEHTNIDAVTISGSLAAGMALQELCARRCVPFQGELGGNNAAIVWDDTDLDRAADEIARGAFGFAGQRCTANRRAIVVDSILETFVQKLTRATAALPWGDPLDPRTVIGPVISPTKASEVAALLERARSSGCRVVIAHDRTPPGPAYHPPAIVVCDDPSHEIVQEETFGPVLVVQRASDFDRAIERLNGVRQGLVAALFSNSPTRREQFLREARAGVLKLDRSTVDADAVSPLGGWKASGVGPAEHGPSDREFFCRVQTIYDG